MPRWIESRVGLPADRALVSAAELHHVRGHDLADLSLIPEAAWRKARRRAEVVHPLAG